MKGNAHRGHELAFGSFGIKTLEEALITARQIEAARQAVTRYMKREGQIWIRIFPTKRDDYHKETRHYRKDDRYQRKAEQVRVHR